MLRNLVLRYRQTPPAQRVIGFILLGVVLTLPLSMAFNQRTSVEELAAMTAKRSVMRQSKADVPDEIVSTQNTSQDQLEKERPAQDCTTCPRMVKLPAGSFVMGSPEDEAGRQWSEGPQRRVSVASFSLSETEVTVAQFAAFVVDTGYIAAGECLGWEGVRFGYSANLKWNNPGFTQSDQHPAVCLSWADAKAYVTWLADKTGKHYRLPNEAEWEYAARAGVSRLPEVEEGETDGICAGANVVDKTFKTSMAVAPDWDVYNCADGVVRTAKVGSYKPNAFGLYDMVGNVWEWVEDCWHYNYLGAPSKGRAWSEKKCTLHVQRGGGWGDSKLGGARPASRSNDAVAERSVYTGFRVALDR
ncbi:MAG: formylglycine-generating enzyme family protein [Candidatus Protistobacter heckmanni]|nr:formylglycine-generating enzyme family protein [Candidatus Protistobacter heckmanni]